MACCLLCLHFKHYQRRGLWGVLHWDSPWTSYRGNQDTQYLKNGVSGRIMGFCVVVSEDGMYPCFHMVISTQAGLCFLSCSLPKRDAVTYFPPTESMQISSKSSVKICWAWQENTLIWKLTGFVFYVFETIPAPTSLLILLFFTEVFPLNFCDMKTSLR